MVSRLTIFAFNGFDFRRLPINTILQGANSLTVDLDVKSFTSFVAVFVLGWLNGWSCPIVTIPYRRHSVVTAITMLNSDLSPTVWMSIVAINWRCRDRISILWWFDRT